MIGGTSGVIAISILQPLDFYKTRLQIASETGDKHNNLGVFKNIIKN